MISAFIKAALCRAHYELMEDGRFFASVPECTGCWAEGASLEECRDELQSTLEDWLLLGLQLGHSLPVIDGLDLNRQEHRHQSSVISDQSSARPLDTQTQER
jgi:predicted RNase H-like HicB family nuclease